MNKNFSDKEILNTLYNLLIANSDMKYKDMQIHNIKTDRIEFLQNNQKLIVIDDLGEYQVNIAKNL